MDNPVFEHKSNDYSTEDPWKRAEREKKKRIAINEENRKANLREAYGDRLKGTLDLQSAMNYARNRNKKQVGNRFEKYETKNRRRGHLNVALRVAQHSTASMGKFDELNKMEPKPKLKKNRKKSVGYMQTAENDKVHQYKFGKESYKKKERSSQHEILYNIFGKEKAKLNQTKAVQHAKYEIVKVRKHKKSSFKKKGGK